MYSAFTLETILATAFGRQVNLQKGESDKFSRSMELILQGFTDGGFETFMLIHSKLTKHLATSQTEVNDLCFFNQVTFPGCFC